MIYRRRRSLFRTTEARGDRRVVEYSFVRTRRAVYIFAMALISFAAVLLLSETNRADLWTLRIDEVELASGDRDF
jgi:hypothetical protein